MKDVKRGDIMHYKDSEYLIDDVVGEDVFYTWPDELSNDNRINTNVATKADLEKAGYVITPKKDTTKRRWDDVAIDEGRIRS